MLLFLNHLIITFDYIKYIYILKKTFIFPVEVAPSYSSPAAIFIMIIYIINHCNLIYRMRTNKTGLFL